MHSALDQHAHKLLRSSVIQDGRPVLRIFDEPFSRDIPALHRLHEEDMILVDDRGHYVLTDTAMAYLDALVTASGTGQTAMDLIEANDLHYRTFWRELRQREADEVDARIDRMIQGWKDERALEEEIGSSRWRRARYWWDTRCSRGRARRLGTR